VSTGRERFWNFACGRRVDEVLFTPVAENVGESWKPVGEGEQRSPYRLYLIGNGQDERETLAAKIHIPYGLREVGGPLQIITHAQPFPVEATVEHEGRGYHLRQLDRHLLFRPVDSPCAAETPFLPDTRIADFPQALQQRPVGRCILYVPEWVEKHHGVYFFFQADGSGFALNPEVFCDVESVLWIVEYERVDFRWDHFLRISLDRLSAPAPYLREHCQELFAEVNSQLQEPYRHHDLQLAWQRGSERELKRLARIICQTEPHLFDSGRGVCVTFRAGVEEKRGGFLYVECFDQDEWVRYTSRRLMILHEMAFRWNAFTGKKWINLSPKGFKLDCPRTVLNPVSLRWSEPSDWDGPKMQRAAVHIRIDVEPPTAHEKAEAFLELVDWLEDKLYDPEKRAQFGLLPRIEADKR